MKHYSFLLLLTLSFFSARSQLAKNTWLVGGSGSFYSYKGEYISAPLNNTTKVINIDINGSIGYFAIDKLALGLRPSFSFNKGKTYEDDIQTGYVAGITNFLMGPFVRYYFLEKEKAFNIVSDVGYQYGFNSDPVGNKGKGTSKQFTASTGIEAFFNSSVALELLLGYKTKSDDLNGDFAYTDKKNGFQVSVGFQIHLEKL